MIFVVVIVKEWNKDKDVSTIGLQSSVKLIESDKKNYIEQGEICSQTW